MTHITRRTFLTATAGAIAGATIRPQTAASVSHRAGANDTIRLGVIGCGQRGTELIQDLAREQGPARVVALCDAYDIRHQQAQALTGADVMDRWSTLIERADLDGIIIATPDHWHAPMAIAAMQCGKDVYCEGPMGRCLEEAATVRDHAREFGCILQAGSPDASDPRWHATREVIANGQLGQVVWSQGNYGASEGASRWNRTIDANVHPQKIDWEAFQGTATPHPFTPDRFFRWRKYAAYSGGIATDLLHDKLCTLLVALGPELPTRVSAAGGIYVQDGRDVPDSFVLTAEYAAGHTIVLASSMGQRREVPAVIRGRDATLYCHPDRLEIIPETSGADLQTAHTVPIADHRPSHLGNWLDSMRSRRPCVCNEDFTYQAMTTITTALESYRSGNAVANCQA